MYSTGYSDPMPSDKMMRLFIIQAMSSFVAHDYDSGLHYINEIKQSYAEHMNSLNPTLKSLAKEIIQSLDMFAPGASVQSYTQANPTQTTPQTTPQTFPTEQAEPTQNIEDPDPQPPSSVTSELQNLLQRRRARRAQKKK